MSSAAIATTVRQPTYAFLIYMNLTTSTGWRWPSTSPNCRCLLWECFPQALLPPQAYLGGGQWKRSSAISTSLPGIAGAAGGSGMEQVDSRPSFVMLVKDFLRRPYRDQINAVDVNGDGLDDWVYFGQLHLCAAQHWYRMVQHRGSAMDEISRLRHCTTILTAPIITTEASDTSI